MRTGNVRFLLIVSSLVSTLVGCGPSPARQPAAVLTVVPTLTPVSEGLWQMYDDTVFGISLRFPADWMPQPGCDRRFAGPDGFFQLSALDREGLTIDEVAHNEAHHKLMPYGSEPVVESLEVHGQQARLILPSADQPREMDGQAALVMHPFGVIEHEGHGYNYLVLWADQAHIRQVANTVRLQVPPPGAVLTVLRVLALPFRMDPTSIQLLHWDRVDWPNGCLGIPMRDKCSLAVVPGYRVIVRIDDQEYEYRSDLGGYRVLLAVGPDHAIEQPVLVWEEGGEHGCQSLLLAADGQAAIGPCDAPQVPVRLDHAPLRLEEWTFIQSQFAPFEADTPRGRVVFRGQGQEIARPAWQRAVASWAHLVRLELELGRCCASWGAFSWKHELLDRPGVCAFLDVTAYGMAHASTTTCSRGKLEYLADAWLTSSLWEQFDEWFYGRSEQSDADLYFRGMGAQEMSEAEANALRSWAESVYARLREE